MAAPLRTIITEWSWANFLVNSILFSILILGLLSPFKYLTDLSELINRLSQNNFCLGGAVTIPYKEKLADILKFNNLPTSIDILHFKSRNL